MISRSQYQSWLEAIPLGSLKQLQNAPQNGVPGPSTPGPLVSEDGASIPLPRRSMSTSDRSHATVGSAVATVVSGQDSAAHMRSSLATTDSAGTHPAQGEVAAAGSRNSSTRHSASAGSRPQLQHPGTPTASGSARGSSVHSAQAPTTGAISDGTRRATSERGPDNHDYWRKLAPLMECLPHLETIGPEYGRHKSNGTISCIDYFRDPAQRKIHERLTIGKSSNHRAYIDRLRELRLVANPDIATRVLLVEDLSPHLIEHLGSTFEIDPEFFAEHLNRSGYDGSDYDDVLPKYWETRNIRKAHVAMRWYRPVLQNPKVTGWLENASSILDRQDTGNSEVPGSIAWEDPAFDRSGRPRENRMEHQAVISTNVFRRSWSLAAAPTSEQSFMYGKRGHADRIEKTAAAHFASSVSNGSVDRETYNWRSKAVLTAWEEKASFFWYRKSLAPIIILLLDPLPRITDHQRPWRRQGKSTRDGFGTAVEMSVPMVPRGPLDFPPNKFEATEHDIARLRVSTTTVVSSLDAIQAQVMCAELPTWQAFRADPILALLRVVQTDSKALFQGLESSLDEISQDSLDDYLMARRLAGWRKLMSDFEIEVPAIGSSLHDFIGFVFGPSDGSNTPQEVSEIVKEMDADIVRLKQRLDDAYSALRADMQFTESRRSINEARTVTKLTELAFVFIPLSFTCSLFSMSIRELQDGVPVWTFVITALVMALLAYGIRLIVASDFVANSSRAALERFWSRRNVRRGESAPVLTLIILTAQEVWRNGGAEILLRCSYALFVAAFIVVPVAFIWTSTRLDSGFHIAITLLLVLSGFAFAGFIYVFGSGGSGERVTAWNRSPSDAESVTSGEEV